MASGARSQDFFGQFGGFLKNLGQKRVGLRPLRPLLWIRALNGMDEYLQKYASLKRVDCIVL